MKTVIEMALEALTHGGCPPDCKDGMTDSGGVHPWGEAALIPCPNCQTIAALREALAEQPAQQEPVAIVDDSGVIVVCSYHYKPGDKLYTSPPAQRTWVGLTDEEIDALREKHSEGRGAGWRFDFKGFARAIEAKLKEKNT